MPTTPLTTMFNFVMLCYGRLSLSFSGQASTPDEFIDRYENGEFDPSDDSEVLEEILHVRDFHCPLCKYVTNWTLVIDNCKIECGHCGRSFVIDDKKCDSCRKRTAGCLAVSPL